MHCVIIPTYNNALTLSGVILEVLNYCAHVVVVNDGSSDSTPEVLQSFGDRIHVIEYFPNRGKGYALRKGFRYAVEKGFRYAVTIDSDGQHFASDIPLLMEASSRNPQALIIGSRQFNQPNMPAKNSFANKFSNFWFTVQTGHRLNDTQTGYRLYPLHKMSKMRFFTSRYETELEILVRLAWKGVPLIPVPVKVYYAPKGERVTHFRKGKDFFRISLLNTALCVAAVLYGYPSMLFRKW